MRTEIETPDSVSEECSVLLERLNAKEGGLLLIDKPYGVTSFSIVNKIRRILTIYSKDKWVKVGHGGTLDPLATGLLIVATRASTKQLANIITNDKRYIVTFRLGVTSPSYDLETKVEIQNLRSGVPDVDKIDQVLQQFTGEQQQIPPVFSAIKIAGKPVYELARKGRAPELTPKKINIFDMSLLQYEYPFLSIDVYCSKGTYIRSLARDIGDALGTGAVVTGLHRTKSGEFTIDDAHHESFLQQLFSFVHDLHKK